MELIRPQDKEGEQHQPFRAHRSQLNWSRDASSPQSQPKRKKSDWPRSMPTLLRKNLDVFRVNRHAHPSRDHAGVKPGGSVSRFMEGWEDGREGRKGRDLPRVKYYPSGGFHKDSLGSSYQREH